MTTFLVLIPWVAQPLRQAKQGRMCPSLDLSPQLTVLKLTIRRDYYDSALYKSTFYLLTFLNAKQVSLDATPLKCKPLS